MSVTLQSRYDNYVTIYNAFLNSLRETFPEVIIQKILLNIKLFKWILMFLIFILMRLL